jgi:hypothetical protein
MRLPIPVFLAVSCCWLSILSASTLAQNDTPTDDSQATFDSGVVVTNERSCVDPNRPPLVISCFKDFTDFEREACPAGWCLTRYDGCTRYAYGERPSKYFEYEQLSTEDVPTPRLALANNPQKKKAKQIGVPIECYRKRPCRCIETVYGSPGNCKAGEWETFALAKYEVLNEDCPVAVAIGIDE